MRISCCLHWNIFLRSMIVLRDLVMLMLLLKWVLVVWQWLCLSKMRLKGGVWVGGGPRRAKMMHGVRVKTTGGRSIRLSPWTGLDSSVHGLTLEHWRVVSWALELWSFHCWTLHWWTIKGWHHTVMVSWSLHTGVTREPRTASPLQLSHSFMCHFVNRFIHETISEKEKIVLSHCVKHWIQMRIKHAVVKYSLHTGEWGIFVPRDICCIQL